MLNKRFGIFLISALFLSECFAIGKVPTAKSGEIACIGGDDGQTTFTNFLFRNLDAKHTISFSNLRLFLVDGSKVPLSSSFQNYQKTLASNATIPLNSTDLLNGSQGGRLMLKVSFSTTDGTSAIAPYSVSVDNLMDASGNTISKDTVECAYTSLVTN